MSEKETGSASINKNMSRPLQRRMLLPLTAVLFLLICGFTASWVNTSQSHMLEHSQKDLQNVKNTFSKLLQAQAKALSGQGEIIMRDPNLIAALKILDRDLLLVDYKPLFAEMLARYSVTHFYFHRPDRVNLLRVHKPEKYGDLINRFTMLEAERTGRISSGIELGPLGTFTLRVVLPIFEGNTLLGYLEIGKEIENVLVDLQEQYGVKLALFIDKNELDRARWEVGMAFLGREADWNQFTDHVQIFNSIPEFPVEFKSLIKGSYSVSEIKWDNRSWHILESSLQDVSGTKVGRLVIRHDISDQHGTFERMLSRVIGGALLLLGLLLSFFYMILKQTDRSIIKQQRGISESEERFRSLFASSQDAIMILEPPLWKFTAGNPATLAMFGIKEESQFLELSPVELSPEVQPNGRLSGAMAKEEIETAMQEGSCFFEWMHRRLDGEDFISTVLLTRVEVVGRVLVQATVRDITEQRQAEEALKNSQLLLESVMNAIPVRVFWKDKNLTYLGCNEAFANDAGFDDPKDMVGKDDYQMVWGEEAELYRADDTQVIESGRSKLLIEEPQTTTAGAKITLLTSKLPMRDPGGEIVGVIGTYMDITERKTLETHLAHAQKLESVGALAAGVAHEINTPIQYLSDNMKFIQETSGDLRELLSTYAELLAAAMGHTDLKEFIDKVTVKEKEVDLEFLNQEIPAAIDQSIEGLAQVARLVRGMKEFAHPDAAVKESVDLNKTIETVLSVSRNEWKYVAEVVTNYESDLPLVSCYPGDLNQVFLNIIVNAAHAIGGAVGHEPGEKGTITISTSINDDRIGIKIADNGPGIPEEIRGKIFDPFFTTKDVGKGTGQGLAIAYSIITDKHGGSLTVDTEPGRGTVFNISLPIIT